MAWNSYCRIFLVEATTDVVDNATIFWRDFNDHSLIYTVHTVQKLNGGNDSGAGAHVFQRYLRLKNVSQNILITLFLAN